MPLETELQYFANQKTTLLETYEGQFVLVRGTELAGAYTTEQEAYEAGLARFGNEPFLIKRVVREEDETAHFPALVLGVLHAYS